MNSHLNLFKSYSREDRTNQLENDLTRALALCLSEETLFLHEILRHIFDDKLEAYDQLFGQISSDSNFEIDIQKNVSEINSFSHLFAVSVSGCKMDCNAFFLSQHNKKYDPITDLIIIINDIAIIFEVKPNNTDCTNQLYNQARNVLEAGTQISSSNVTPVDLNWGTLMEKVVKIYNFQKTIGYQSRFLGDFIEMIQHHNAGWMPILPFKSQIINKDKYKLYERLIAAINMSGIPQVKHSDRTGITVTYPWASEILFDFYQFDEKQVFRINIWPGNTKAQGWKLYPASGEPHFKDKLSIAGKDYDIIKKFHVKFTHFQKYIAHLEGNDSDLDNQSITTAQNFRKISGRKKKDNWNVVEDFFDLNFKDSFEWRSKALWEIRFKNTNRTYFDLTLGYHLYIDIPFEELQKIDTDKEDYGPLTNFLEEIEQQFKSIIK